MADTRYQYEYFCGANVSISMNNFPLLDCAGISYSVLDSQAPIYGYSSRLFDAVAPGQKLVQGSFVVNFTTPNSVYDVVESGRTRMRSQLLRSHNLLGMVEAERDKRDMDFDDNDWARIKLAIVRGSHKDRKKAFEDIKDQGLAPGIKAHMEEQMTKLLQFPLPTGVHMSTAGTTDVTMSGPMEIGIYFGDLTSLKRWILYGVHIVGHGSTIQIDENVILEEYNFFARDMVPWDLFGK